MTIRELLELVKEYNDKDILDNDTEIFVEVFHDDDTTEVYPLTMASCHTVDGYLTLHAQGDFAERN
jgi:hypothetical protein